MIFLIEYDRESGKLITFRSFDEADQTAADRARLEMELDLLRSGVEREVVILEAPNEGALRRTHRRYFEDLEELAKVS